MARSKRVRDGEILAESELDKWTSEGLVKREVLVSNTARPALS